MAPPKVEITYILFPIRRILHASFLLECDGAGQFGAALAGVIDGERFFAIVNDNVCAAIEQNQASQFAFDADGLMESFADIFEIVCGISDDFLADLLRIVMSGSGDDFVAGSGMNAAAEISVDRIVLFAWGKFRPQVAEHHISVLVVLDQDHRNLHRPVRDDEQILQIADALFALRLVQGAVIIVDVYLLADLKGGESAFCLKRCVDRGKGSWRRLLAASRVSKSWNHQGAYERGCRE